MAEELTFEPDPDDEFPEISAEECHPLFHELVDFMLEKLRDGNSMDAIVVASVDAAAAFGAQLAILEAEARRTGTGGLLALKEKLSGRFSRLLNSYIEDDGMPIKSLMN